MEVKKQFLDDIRAEAKILGFSLFGVTSPKLPAHLEKFKKWLDEGYAGDMHYLSRKDLVEKRMDIRELFSVVRAIICLGYPYPAPIHHSEAQENSFIGKVASYAWIPDYHEILSAKIIILCKKIENIINRKISYRICVDSSPILEREFATIAGLGWIGKNTNLISPKFGSTFLLSEVLMDCDLPDSRPFQNDQCGNCHRCMDACPTKCILTDRTIDARQCISYLTIENQGIIPVQFRKKLGNWVFGCDICQMVCPWNKYISTPVPKASYFINPSPNLLTELDLTEEQFSNKYRGSSLLRAKWQGYIRNIINAIGNSRNPAAVSQLAKFLRADTNAILRAHSAWALGQFESSLAKEILWEQLLNEKDPLVMEEIRLSLEKKSPE